jgi:hypothetical protein
MIHYKVSQDIIEGHLLTLCGKRIPFDVDFEDDYRHIPPCDHGCQKLAVNCSKCLTVYKAVKEDK